jgi:predicted ATPase
MKCMASEQGKTKAWISELSFAGMRRLNSYSYYGKDDPLEQWLKSRTRYAFGQINIFSGPNGGGKSTVLELIDLMRNPDRICGLPRENRPHNSYSFLHIQLRNDGMLHATISPGENSSFCSASNLKNEPFRQAVQFLIQDLASPRKFKTYILERNISKSTLDDETRSELLEKLKLIGPMIYWWEANHDVTPARFVDVLTRFKKNLSGLASDPKSPMQFIDPDMESAKDFIVNTPLSVSYEDRIQLHYSDDVLQGSVVEINRLPSGWRQIVTIVCFLQDCPDGSVCLMEEPEVHLHPRLQRSLISVISSIAESKSLQLFITTHSQTFLSRHAWQAKLEMKYFEAGTHELIEGINDRRVFDALGINGTDQGLSNGVIWVEGPSDCTYIKHWISLYCAHTGIDAPVEDVDYVFVRYGGALLKHMVSGSEISFNVDDRCRINRNFIVLVDNDNDFDDDPGLISSLFKAKKAMENYINKLESSQVKFLHTKEYTIESSLPKKFRDEFFTLKGSRLIKIKSRKTLIAEKYVKQHPDWSSCFDPTAKLDTLVETIVATVREWSSN